LEIFHVIIQVFLAKKVESSVPVTKNRVINNNSEENVSHDK